VVVIVPIVGPVAVIPVMIVPMVIVAMVIVPVVIITSRPKRVSARASGPRHRTAHVALSPVRLEAAPGTFWQLPTGAPTKQLDADETAELVHWLALKSRGRWWMFQTRSPGRGMAIR